MGLVWGSGKLVWLGMAGAASDEDAEDSFVFDELASPASLIGPSPSTNRRWNAWFTGWNDKVALSGGRAAALESFSKRFEALLLRAPADKGGTADAAAAGSEVVSTRQARRDRRQQLLICREVAWQVVGPGETLELQRLVREHCRRPCAVLRAATLQSVAEGHGSSRDRDHGGGRSDAACDGGDNGRAARVAHVYHRLLRRH